MQPFCNCIFDQNISIIYLSETQMDLWTSILVGLLFSFILIKSLLFLADLGKSKKLPPGPYPLPVIGSLHILGQQPHQSLAKLAQVFGPIMSLKLGHMTTVVISSPSTAKEVLKTQDLAFSSRSVPDAVHVHNHSQNSVVWLPVGPKWRNIRKLMATVIFSSNRLDANLHLRTRKVQELIAYCDTSCKAGKTVDIGQAAFRTSLNLMSNTIFSKDLTDPFQDSANEFKEVIENIMVELGKPNLADYFPLLKFIDPQGIRRNSSLYFGKLIKLFGVLVNERLESRKARKIGGNGTDLLDLCLDISEENPEEIDIPHFKNMFMDLFFGGTDTTSSTLEWGMAELLRNPEIMVKAKVELDEVIGKGKILEESDISRLPYLQCVMKETLRLHPPVPLLVPRKVECDAEVNGYLVPKGSQVIVNAWAIARDPRVWEDSLTFKPDRFLTLERDMKGQDFELIPFGSGRRICPGLPLAVRMVMVMLGSLINSFDWKIDGGIEAEELDMSEKFGITLHKAKPLRAVPVTFAM